MAWSKSTMLLTFSFCFPLLHYLFVCFSPPDLAGFDEAGAAFSFFRAIEEFSLKLSDYSLLFSVLLMSICLLLHHQVLFIGRMLLNISIGKESQHQLGLGVVKQEVEK